MRKWLEASTAAFVIALVFGTPSVAVALDDGVHVDPDTPAGKEYALPLDAARREAGGSATSGRGRGGDAAPLFGVGISKTGGRGSDSRGSGANDGRSKSRAGSGQAKQGSSGVGIPSTSAARVVADAGGGISAGLLTVLIAAAVLGIGGLIGLSVRALRGEHPST